MSQTINALGKEIDDAFHPDMQNIFAGAVTVQQPVFMGGKIVAANRIAKLAEELSETQYDQQYQHHVFLEDIPDFSHTCIPLSASLQAA